MTPQEFEAILADTTKRVLANIVWHDDTDHIPAREFRAVVSSEPSWPITVIGWWHPRSGKLSYGLLHSQVRGRVVGLDLGYPPHRNPNGGILEGTHKHLWTIAFKGDQAYAPSDITAKSDQPLEVWRQFCAETAIVHEGVMHQPAWRGPVR